MNKIAVILFLFIANFSKGQSFAPAAGQLGSTAISKDSSIIASWANGISLTRGYLNAANTGLGTASFGNDANALGMAEGDGVSIVSLGDGGVATLTFAAPITNVEGPDFAVFENGFADNYMEFAHVEVSSDGVHFVRFPSTSELPTIVQIDNFSYSDCRFVNNLAGKYRQGFGTPFNLDDLTGAPLVDLNAITHVRLIDVVGSIDPLYGSTDQYGTMINDPFPTEFDSGGFDLDGVAVLNQLQVQLTEYQYELSLFPNPSEGKVTINLNGEGSIRLFSPSGKLLEETQVFNSKTIDLSVFSEKVILLQIILNGVVHTERIIIN